MTLLPRPGVALVILAAGESLRLGRCKALVPLTPKTPVELLSAAGACLDAAPPLVITGSDHEEIEAAIGRMSLKVETARNENWRAGRTGGVLLAARLRPGLDLCLAPVDVPLVPASVFETLLATWTSAGSPPRGWLAPSFTPARAAQPRFGHPVVAGRELVGDLRGAGPAVPLHRLREGSRPLFSVPVQSAEILDDLDTPADFRRLRVRGGG